ncbi:caspase recruitment domain-containing protein 9 isoform X2 [Clupea harengus]|uniref:Caspase recruitment domain-containing protein 9 isoform X2 n=1 Tax=Clupea harengus TaxID=7950 RepID=A0A6P8H0A5_CLUHA|nr:caspase recruitment domain-containing protein 9 isoform X2 [Clupea harengus]
MTDDMSVLDLDEDCWSQLEDYRLLLIKTIEPTRITPYLRQCRVLSSEDEEQIYNDPSLVIRRRKVGVLLDILQRTGIKGYTAFLESLELDYPQLYQKITGKEPARVFSILVDTVGESGLTQYLMSEVTRLQKQVEEEHRRLQEASKRVATLDDTVRQQEVRERELQKQQERVRRLREDRDRLWDEARQLKDENYSLMHDLTRLSEEKNSALMSNRDLQLSIEKLKHSLMNAESDSKIQRKRTITLKNAIELRPSPDTIWKLQTQNDLLTARIQELEDSRQEPPEPDEQEISRQVMEDYKQHACTQYQELVNSLNTLRRELQEAEQLRSKYLEEKEVLELKCTMLRKDSKMYHDRMEDILKQMEQVINERNKAMSTREEYHKEISQSLQEKDEYRKQIRELGERCDEVQVQLLRAQGKVLSLQTQLRRQNCPYQASDVEDSSLASSYELRSQTSEEECLTKAKKESQSQASGERNVCGAIPDGGGGLPSDKSTNEDTEKILKEDELPTSCRPRANFYYRRKRALRTKTAAKVNAPCELDNTSGSDNTDTDGL